MASAFIAGLVSLSLSLAATASHGADKSGHEHGGTHAEHGLPPPVATGRPTQEAGRSKRSDQKAWTSTPLLLPFGRGDRVSADFSAANLAANHLVIRDPSTPGHSRKVAAENGVWHVKPIQPGQGGFHWLKVEARTDSGVQTASTFWYSPNHGSSPETMLDTPGEGLEIVPQPIPDHDAYYEGRTWQFLVRYGNKPVERAELILETEFGSKIRALADTQGIVNIVFPRDFDPKLWEGKPIGRTRAGFVVSTTHEIDGIKHRAAFNYSYAPDPLRQRSLLTGAGLTFVGMLLAMPLLFRKKAAGSSEGRT